MILMLTGLDSVEDKMKGLDSGADDYVAKPFQLKEVSARIRALLRRVNRLEKLNCGRLTVDIARHEAKIEEKKLDLFPREFALLAFLVENPGKLHSVDRILREVWSDTEDATENAVRTCIARLRKQLEDASMPGLIVTVPGSGYRLDLPE
jgi:DNA-binding response OmpR family regulator